MTDTQAAATQTERQKLAAKTDLTLQELGALMDKLDEQDLDLRRLAMELGRVARRQSGAISKASIMAHNLRAMHLQRLEATD